MTMKLLLLCSLVGRAAACGGFFCAPQQPVVQSGEAIIFGVKDRNVSMHIQINYEGPAEDFSWLLPVMFEPTLTTSSETFFQSMFSQTLPQFNFRIEEPDKGECVSDQPAFPCPVADFAPEAAAGSDGVPQGVEVKEGSVGPFDYKIIKAVDRNVAAIRTWLAENGYDEYAGSVPIIDHYVQSDHYFVALRLKKDTDTGDLVPIVIEYEMTEDMETVACVPLILTGVAATETMPILVHILGEFRADPVNYFRVELDERKVDWMGCQFNPSCYERDYRDRAEFAFRTVNDHAFVEEYAGPSDVMKDQIRFDIDEATLAQSASLLDFLNALADANVPSHRLLDNILNDYVPLEFNGQAPFFCASLPSIYNPLNTFQMGGCVNSLVKQEYDFVALAAEIQEKVLAPADAAQTFTDSFSYMTRMWVSMRQEKMVKDPFFQFREDSTLPDVSNVHSAVGVPVCDAAQNEFTEMEITVRDGSTTRIPVSRDPCFGWSKTNFDPLYGENNSPMLQLVVPGFGVEKERFLLRQEDGTFNRLAIEESFALMDARVMNQTIAQTPAPVVAPITDSPVADPTATPTASPVALPTASPVALPVETNSPTKAPTAMPTESTSSSQYTRVCSLFTVSMFFTMLALSF